MNELVQQFERGALPNYQIKETVKSGNQYRLLIQGNNRTITVLIGTIDSFTYAIRKRKDNASDFDGQDMFKQIVDDICRGNMTVGPNGEIKYAGINPRLTSDCLIIIDEGQDLEVKYIEAFDNIINRTGIDTYIIGDKLQSIMSEKNLFTHLENSNSSKIIKNTGANVVKRFHNKQFMPFVNNICKFSNHDLPEITGICDGNCGYKHEDQVKPYIVDYSCPNIYTDDNDSISKYVDTLIESVREKVYEYGYLPNNFCFIFPVVNDRNKIISLLYPALENMWIRLFECSDVYSEALIANMQKSKNYWKQKLEQMENDTRYYQYVHWHSSEKNGTIDLTESENATRILSIHSSKGTGCECVYLLGLSEQVIGFFTGGVKNTLVYESLLHVGLTRQKKYLHVGIVRGSDDINKRFGAIIQDEHAILEPKLSDVRKHIRTTIISDEFRDPSYCNDYRVYINNDVRKTVDWGHHVIRNSVLKMNAERYLILNTPDDHLDQKFKTLIYSNRSEIEYVRYNEYKKYLAELDKSIQSNTQNKNKAVKLVIPVIVFAITNQGKSDYSKFRGVAKSLCESVVSKLKSRNLNFCPIECLMYCHLMELIQHPYELSVSMMDIYKILSYYSDAPFEHREYGCNCHLHFTKTCSLGAHANIQSSIINHHKAIERIDSIMKNMLQNVPRGLKFKVDTRKQWITDTFILNNRIDICTEPSEDGTIYCVKLVAQFNNMNYISVLSEIAFNKFMLLKNPEYKKVEYYIATLDYHEPIYVSEQPDLDTYLANYFKNYGNKMHTKVFNFFTYYGKDVRNGVREVYDKMKTEYENTLPEYIMETMEELDKKYRKKQITRDNLDDQAWFVEQLKDNLEYKVDALFDFL
jgi:hypothetical protein